MITKADDTESNQTINPIQTAPAIYLDYNATTPVADEVYEQMLLFFKDHFGNAASASHPWGWKAENAVKKARSQVANLIGAKPEEIIFTSGATESNNWVLFGLISKIREENPDEPIHIISSRVEHSSILKTLEALKKLNIGQKQNIEIDLLPVNSYGQIEIETLIKALKPHTKLISLIWVNNEVGSFNPLAEVAKIAKQNKIYLHTDATQAAGKIPVEVNAMGLDLMSFSGHKIYGPKGIGALYIRSQNPKVQINPLIYGGGHERGLRSGTLNVPGIVGFGAAAEFCQAHLTKEQERQKTLRELFWTELEKNIPGVKLNGHPTERAANNLNITLPVKTEMILTSLQKLGVSTGSACGSGGVTLSHVLTAMGLSPDEIQKSLRISIGLWTNQEEILRAVEVLRQATAQFIK